VIEAINVPVFVLECYSTRIAITTKSGVNLTPNSGGLNGTRTRGTGTEEIGIEGIVATGSTDDPGHAEPAPGAPVGVFIRNAVLARHPPGPPKTLGNMRELGVHHLIAYCLSDTCRHSALIDVWTVRPSVLGDLFEAQCCTKCRAENLATAWNHVGYSIFGVVDREASVRRATRRGDSPCPRSSASCFSE
jgi:hypothetical protein